MNKDKIELLAPAGDIESFKAACIGGADAIYMGLSKFNARNMAKNFDIDEYIKCIEYAHLRGIKVYLTLNTLLKSNEVEEAIDLVIKLYLHGLDAVIMQDIGLANIIHKLLPKLHMHASTQMSAYSLDQVKFLQKNGFSRVVLARELSINEIEYICKNSDVEIEVFVHGALCVSMSGQCLLSSVIGNRSANRGECAQPCRMKYSLCNIKGKEVINERYLLSKKDILGLEYVDKLKNIGVSSLKIEGRNKNPEYVLGVTKIYRKAIDNSNKIIDIDKLNLKQLFNRDGQSDGYLGGVRYKESITLSSPKNTGIYLGQIISSHKEYIKIKLEEDINLHDGIEIYSEGKVVSNIVTCIKDENLNLINTKVEKGNIVYLGDFKNKVKNLSKVYKTSSASLNKSLRDEYLNSNRRRNIDIEINILKDKKINAKIKSEELDIVFDIIPQIAEKKSLVAEDIINVFSKTLDEPFKFERIMINLDDGLFLSISKLNEFRRQVISKLKERYIISFDEKEEKQLLRKKKEIFEDISKELDNLKDSKVNTKENTLFIYKYNKDKNYIEEYGKLLENVKLNTIYFNISDLYKFKEDIIQKYKGKVNISLYIQNFIGPNLDKIIKENIKDLLDIGIYNILLGSFAYYHILKDLKEKCNFNMIADYSFNITNIYSAYYITKLGFDKITPSVELDINDYSMFDKYFNIEIVTDIITAMTSRYCILGSFIGDKTKENNCKRPCKDEYYLKDIHGAKYYITCDDIDCIMRLVKYRKKEEYKKIDVSKRHCIL